jgi:hypothetical protein
MSVLALALVCIHPAFAQSDDGFGPEMSIELTENTYDFRSGDHGTLPRPLSQALPPVEPPVPQMAGGSCQSRLEVSSSLGRIRQFLPLVQCWYHRPSDERFAILDDELLDRHRLAATDFSDIVVRAGKDAVAVVDGDFMKVLHQECIRRAAGK